MTLHDNNNNVRDTHDIEGVLLQMGFQDYAAQHNIELNENDNAQYEQVSRMYIRENAREGYQSCMKRLLIFLYDKNPDCFLDYAKKSIARCLSKRGNGETHSGFLSSGNSSNLFMQLWYPSLVFSLIYIRLTCSYEHCRSRRVHCYTELHNPEIPYEAIRLRYRDYHAHCYCYRVVSCIDGNYQVITLFSLW